MIKRMFFRYATALVLISSAIAVEIHAQSLTASAATANAPKVGPKALYPNPSLTRGKAQTLNASDLSRLWPCPQSIHKPNCSYSQAHRDVPATVKKRIYAEYGINPRTHPPGEIDHFYPLCAGGSNDITNLWFQPEANVWNGRNYGFHEKDDLEAWVCEQIKAGALDARSAFDRLTTDWVKFYDEVKPGHQSKRVE
ncbi:MAG TPA: hypothetical protein VIY49_17995 [Bryobacteraceae bacterium]